MVFTIAGCTDIDWHRGRNGPVPIYTKRRILALFGRLTPLEQKENVPDVQSTRIRSWRRAPRPINRPALIGWRRPQLKLSRPAAGTCAERAMGWTGRTRIW